MDPATAQRLYPKGSWVLVGPNMTGPSRDVFWTSKAWGAFIVQPSPPKNPREQPRWFRKYRGFTYVMQHFSASEFISLGLVLNLLWGVFVLTKPFSLARCLDLMERHSHKWGPSAHLCVVLERDLLSPEKYIEDVTGSRDRVWLHPMDRGKFWEPAQRLAYLLSDVLSLCSDDSLMRP